MLVRTMLVLSLLVCLSQRAIAGDEPLADYEGLYEHRDTSSLFITAGPEHELLYAVINGARYPLRPFGDDVFLNAGDGQVLFVRDPEGRVIGYRELANEHDDSPRVFAMLDREQRLPRSFWHAAPEGAPLYTYRSPPALGDGIPVGVLGADDPLRERLVAMTRGIRDNDYPWTQSVLVSRDGRLMYEEYFYEYDRDTRHQLRSATKSLVALLAGIAIDRGLFESVDEPVLPHFDHYDDLLHEDDAKRSITLRHLLSMRSGLACDDWDADSPGNENRMGESDDWVRFTLDLPMLSAPGTAGSYCSGNVAVVGRMIELASGMGLKEFADTFLFGPMGITDYEWDFRPDRSNIDNFAQAWMRPRDMLKVGMLIDQRGEWGGRQLISAAWIDELASAQGAIQGTPYGYYFWLRHIFDGQRRYEIPQVSGNGGQKIILLPDQQAIVVMTGGNYNQASNTNRILVEHLLDGLE